MNIELQQEARHLSRSLFGEGCSPSIGALYEEAHRYLADLSLAPASQANTVQIIVGNQLDAVAIEPWLRRQEQRHLLTAKLLLICYLTECEGNRHEFSRCSQVGSGVLVYGAFHSFISLLRGLYLKMRYGLV